MILVKQHYIEPGIRELSLTAEEGFVVSTEFSSEDVTIGQDEWDW